MTPCEQPTDPKLMVWCGFRPTFTMHDWCASFYVGRDVRGKIVRCKCKCHRKPKQLKGRA